ncbi:MAG: hypothetical protein ACI4V4_00200 [Eubacterium sp.]
MNFFDNLIDDFYNSVSRFSCNSYSYNAANIWQDLGQNELVMQRESAYELDGVGFNLVTSKNFEDEITVIGDDLSEISGDRKFARISVISIDDVDDEQKAYDLIRKIEYVKYHFFPKGYMIRTSSRSHKEVVRISKSAVNTGISFEKIGNLLIDKYKSNPAVKAVHIFFITEQSVDYKQLETLAVKNHSITETLNHIMNNVNFDCSSCNLKPICDEVEGMRELHFKTAGKQGM